MNGDAEYTIGLDVGGTRIKAGAVTRDGRVIHGAVMPTQAHEGPERIVAAAAQYVRAAEGELGRAARAVGLGLSGAVDPELGPVLLPGKFRGLEGFPIVSRLREA